MVNVVTKKPAGLRAARKSAPAKENPENTMEASDISDVQEYPESARAEASAALHTRWMIRGVLTTDREAHARRQRRVPYMKWPLVLGPVISILEIILQGPLGIAKSTGGVIQALIVLAMAILLIVFWKTANRIDAYRELERLEASVDQYLDKLMNGETLEHQDEGEQLSKRGRDHVDELSHFFTRNMKRPLLLGGGGILVAVCLMVFALS